MFFYRVICTLFILFSFSTLSAKEPSKSSVLIAKKTTQNKTFKTDKMTKKLSLAESFRIIKTLDDKQSSYGDYRALSYLKETEKNKDPKINQVIVFRRDVENKFMILFTKPKVDAGKGYLKIDKNLWFYDPSTGKWERRTERERIGGTNSRRRDFDESRLAQDYEVKFLKFEKLGPYQSYVFKLQAKKNVEVSYPVLEIWVDKKHTNLLKRKEYSLSGKLMRTTYYPKWSKKMSPVKKDYVWTPQEIRIYDELEKGASTIIVVKQTDLSPLPKNIFTKAWLETKSK